jgi:hypothetical protein
MCPPFNFLGLHLLPLVLGRIEQIFSLLLLDRKIILGIQIRYSHPLLSLLDTSWEPYSVLNSLLYSEFSSWYFQSPYSLRSLTVWTSIILCVCVHTHVHVRKREKTAWHYSTLLCMWFFILVHLCWDVSTLLYFTWKELSLMLLNSNIFFFFTSLRYIAFLLPPKPPFKSYHTELLANIFNP